MERYQVKGITGGTDAIGEVSCLLRFDEVSVRGHGQHTDIIMASAYAFVDALNRFAYRENAGKRGQLAVGP